MLPKYAQEIVNVGGSIDKYFCVNCKQHKYFNISMTPPLCIRCGHNESLEVKRTLTGDQKELIREESGGKCANPGCAVWRTHIHHIDEWAIYHSDEPEILIPVCPSCHDQIHHGSLPISREVLLQWKKIKRNRCIRNLHIYVEPGNELKLKAGGVWFANPVDKIKLKLFELIPSVKIDFNTQGNKISLVDISITDIEGNVALVVLSNYIEVRDEELDCEERKGHIRITTKNINKFLPKDYVQKMRDEDSGFANDKLVVLELEVLGPGQLAINGCWYNEGQAVVMTDNGLTFVPQMASFVSNDSSCVLRYSGDDTLMYTGVKKVVEKVSKVNCKKKNNRKSQKISRRKNRK